MKILVRLIVLSCIILLNYSCTEESQNLVSEENTPRSVKFSINNFSLDIEDIPELRNSSHQFKYLSYEIYRENETKYEEKVVEGENIPETIDLKLNKGKYTINIILSEVPFKKSLSDISGTGEFNRHTEYTPLAINGDAFGTTLTFEVSDQDIEQEISLDRIVGKVEIYLKDIINIPSDVETLTPILVSYIEEQSTTTGDIFRSGYPIYPYDIRLTAPYESVYLSVGNKINESAYSSVKIHKDQFSSIDINTPISLYLPSTIHMASHPGSLPPATRYDLYLQGAKTRDIQNIEFEDKDGNLVPILNDNTVFLKLIKKDINSEVNKILRIKGDLFTE
jgi:hypothetical protein